MKNRPARKTVWFHPKYLNMSTAVLARKACTNTNNHINFVHESARLHPNILTDGKEFKKNNTIILTQITVYNVHSRIEELRHFGVNNEFY